ncbi:uncharacterized protein M421DRAFT_381772 [Didymella exigua CBS 183.55]|uniref:Uncharacterized protein n=1 Tax=Didymella exigua CBS 183.55 TaxID=1150837 RepID=A0A6A5RXI3_9PLEO|nr:uncharacterized protein M421DRAFT_381772 [Didymella exigua CBS 183.55]KAF1929967.1 hypothetical protein M421DRAFT_381772 [Didymella exigua CBS 183.55]
MQQQSHTRTVLTPLLTVSRSLAAKDTRLVAPCAVSLLTSKDHSVLACSRILPGCHHRRVLSSGPGQPHNPFHQYRFLSTTRGFTLFGLIRLLVIAKIKDCFCERMTRPLSLWVKTICNHVGEVT